ncbi:hypothetical protein BCR33DRAFT_371395 [Rhizoclosmatium globosum]|uniref:Uncharacterized protein n=1 Tax=Rhizoclosmatium globosum TaxID=329046 RepID=A0A1Y2C1J3_9FUNG|nr:hypothetical protein BCR33DRAFT_371395 [Rhizoclosmatium globosum]|eukprot:ORY40175.1 hypothetical protein BCR33DRAFT_371395 [Rhizoclosmatium globosum]
MLDASAILRESLDLKQKLILLQKQLLSGLIQVERVVDLVTPGVDPVVQAEIFHDSIKEDEEEEPLDIFPAPSSRRGSDLNYGELQKLSESSKGHPHFSTSSLVHKVQNNLRRQSRTWVDSQLLMLEPEPVPVVPPLPAAYGLLTKEDPDSPKNSPPSIEDSGIRWDNEDYIKSSEFLSTSPSPLKKSASMINKKLTRQTTNGSIATLAGGLFRRGTNWMSSNGSNVLSERTGGDIAGGHTTGSISRALGSATAGLGRMPILAPSLRSKESIRRQRVAPPPSPNHQAKSLFPATSSGVIGPNSLEASVQRSSSVTTSPSLQRRPKGEGVSKVSNHPPRFQSVISENQEASYSESLGGGNALRPDDIINTSTQEMKYLDNTSENEDGIVTPGKLSTTQEPNPSIRAPSVVLSFATQTPPTKAEDSFAVTVEYPTVERRKNHIQKSGVMQAPNAVLVSTNFSPKRIPNEAFPGKTKSKPDSSAAPVHTGTSEAGGGSPAPERNSTFLAPALGGGGGGHLGTLGNSPQKTSLSRHSLIKIAEPIPDAEFDFATTLTHQIFTCAAFDEKGYYIPVEHRQGI